MAKTYEQEVATINLIGGGTIIKGEVVTNGDFRIDGHLFGSIESQSKIVVGPSGVVDGEIKCQNAEFSGEVRANVKVSELLTLKSTSRLTGDIVVGKLAIEPGAILTGHCSMDDGLKPMESAQNDTEK